jgi:hypothetical protein
VLGLMSISLLMPGASTSSGPIEKVITIFLGIVLILLGVAGDRFTISGFMKGAPEKARTVPRWIGRAIFVPLGIWLLYRSFF